ncbi:MAG: hypothetical protein RSB05_08650, partial [Clostridiales bacterium]
MKENDVNEKKSQLDENTPDYIKRLDETYTQAAKGCGVTLWIFDIATKTIYDLNNVTHIKDFDNITTIQNVPEVFA